MATKRRRGERYQVQVRCKGCAPISRSFLKKADALEWARAMDAKADRRGLPANLKELQSVTVAQLLERSLEAVVSKKRAAGIETYIVKALIRQPFSKLSLVDLSPQVIAQYGDERLKAVKPVTPRALARCSGTRT